MLGIIVGRNLFDGLFHQVARVAGMDDYLFEHIRVRCQPYSLFFYIFSVQRNFRIVVSEVRYLHFLGLYRVLDLEGKFTVGIRNGTGCRTRNRDVHIFQALFAFLVFHYAADRDVITFVCRIGLCL